MTAAESENKDLIRDLIDVVINGHEIEATSAFCADDLTVKGAGMTHWGVGEFKDFLTGVDRAFPDFAFALEDILAEGKKVAFYVTVTGTHEGGFEGIPPTGKEFSYPAVMIATVEDGSFTEIVYESDRVGLMKQLGVLD